MHRTFLRLLITVAILIVVQTCSFAAESYLNDVSSAVTHIEQGDYDKAVEEINAALIQRSDDPLVHLALGTVFLHIRQPDKAFKEFGTVHNLSNNHPLAMYGLALYYMANDDCESAKNYFNKINAKEYDTAPALAYLSAVSGRFPMDSSSTDPVIMQIVAQDYYQHRKFAEAKDIYSNLASNWNGYEEEFGTVMTFDASKPVAFTGPSLSKPYKSPADPDPKIKKVSGVVTLKAELTSTENEGSFFVLYFIDDAMIAMVNHSPYECEWDTRKFSNTSHMIKIQGVSQNGIVFSERTMKVKVSNKNSQKMQPEKGKDIEQLEHRLWECLKLKPSRRLGFYNLSKCAESQNDELASITALERVVAIDPEYKDSRALLIKKYSPLPRYQEIWKGRHNEKIAAITFDDGPNPNTAKILDILAKKDVKATFFAVGSMAELYPDMLRRIASEGHEIESHTYSHRNLQFLSDYQIERELLRTQCVIRNITGKTFSYFRAPGGHSKGNNLERTGGKYGFDSIFWTVNCSRYEGTKPAKIINQVNSETVPGSIILMHNVEDVTLQALPTIIDNLKAKGYKLVTLKELLGK